MAVARQSADPERGTTGLSHHSPARSPVPHSGVLAGQPKDPGPQPQPCCDPRDHEEHEPRAHDR
jgi:hypothetical protein